MLVQAVRNVRSILNLPEDDSVASVQFGHNSHELSGRWEPHLLIAAAEACLLTLCTACRVGIHLGPITSDVSFHSRESLLRTRNDTLSSAAQESFFIPADGDDEEFKGNAADCDGKK